jgi:hypothetical protein
MTLGLVVNPFFSLVKIIGVDLELEEFEKILKRDRNFENIVYYIKKLCNIFIILYTSLFFIFLGKIVCLQ